MEPQRAIPLQEAGSVELLKALLENLDSPERLNAHPWASSWMVAQECKARPALRQQSPGRRLAVTVAAIFRSMLPPGPPRQGKRLDTRWGVYGLLGARYFVPFLYGRPYPASLREAWHAIDDAIQLLAFDGHHEASEAQRAAYRLVEREPWAAPESTISDWHRKGIQRLAKAIELRQQYGQYHGTLAAPQARGLVISQEQISRKRSLAGAAALAAVLLLAFSAVGVKAWRLRTLADRARQDAISVRELAARSEFAQAGQELANLKTDIDALHKEAEPVLWLGQAFGWLPVYGESLNALPSVLELSEEMVTAAGQAYGAVSPLLTDVQDSGSLDLPELTQALLQVQPSLDAAQQALDRARAARSEISSGRLTPGLQRLLAEDVDPALALMEDSVAVGLALPKMMGATGEGPKTYLLLVQNEDELRPTGGFIAAVGTLVVMDGRIISLAFEDSYDFDDWTKAYPPAPWQLRQYMDIPILTLRDSNWFSDYRETASNAEYLYSLARGHSVDGVLALDQHSLVLILEAVGPIQVEDVSYPVTAQNAIAYMRSAKTPPPPETRPQDWHRKAFIGKLANAILNRLLGGEAIPWVPLSRAITRALDERHVLLQLDDTTLTGLLARRGWDGSIEPGSGDFLMVVEANVGYSKSNAAMQSGLAYEVDLRDIRAPRAILTILQKNNSPVEVPCDIMQDLRAAAAQQLTYATERCYWGYLRVYKSLETGLMEATPHAIPGSQMMRGQDHAAQVDDLREETAGLQAFGTLVLVPGGQTLTTSFSFRLPQRVILEGSGPDEYIYRLKIQKQPGSIATPLALRVHLPAQAAVVSVPQGAIGEGDYVQIEVKLQKDALVEIVFTLP